MSDLVGNPEDRFSQNEAQILTLFFQQSVAENGRITDVKGIMDTWILQMNYPTVKIEYTNEGEIRLSQSRYLRDYNATDPGKFVSPYG